MFSLFLVKFQAELAKTLALHSVGATALSQSCPFKQEQCPQTEQINFRNFPFPSAHADCHYCGTDLRLVCNSQLHPHRITSRSSDIQHSFQGRKSVLPSPCSLGPRSFLGLHSGNTQAPCSLEGYTSVSQRYSVLHCSGESQISSLSQSRGRAFPLLGSPDLVYCVTRSVQSRCQAF